MTDDKKSAPLLLAHKFFVSEVVAINWDKTTNLTMVTCSDGAQYEFKAGEAVPKLHAKVSVIVEIDL